MKTLVFFVEGKSEKIFLETYLPRVFIELKERDVIFIPMGGKQSMNKKHGLPTKISNWLKPDTIFIILQDQDGEDCRKTRERLVNICQSAIKRGDYKIRIACRQLENWFLGDIDAVENQYGRIPPRDRNKFNNKVDSKDGFREITRITREQYQKTSGSRSMGRLMSTNYRENKSHSFRVFCQCVEKSLTE